MLLFARYIESLKKYVQQGEKLLHGFAYQCYYCGKFFATSDRQKQHMEHCSGVPGIAYNFSKNILKETLY